MKTLLMIVVAVALCGCSGIRKQPALMQVTSLGTKVTYTYADPADENYFLNGYDSLPLDKKQVKRNQVIEELMGLIDDDFEQFTRRLRAGKVAKNLMVKIASIALTGAAPFSSGPAAKALAGIDTGLKAASEAVDVEAWNKQVPEILINTMQAERAKVATDINTMMKKKVAEYSMQAAIRDLIRYRNAGHITPALAALARQAAESATTEETAARTAKK